MNYRDFSAEWAKLNPRASGYPEWFAAELRREARPATWPDAGGELVTREAARAKATALRRAAKTYARREALTGYAHLRVIVRECADVGGFELIACVPTRADVGLEPSALPWVLADVDEESRTPRAVA